MDAIIPAAGQEQPTLGVFHVIVSGLSFASLRLFFRAVAGHARKGRRRLHYTGSGKE
jgi:hypothetical protein